MKEIHHVHSQQSCNMRRRYRRVRLPAHAGDPIQHLGPVGPDEAITTTFGSKGVIAFYEPDGAHCGLYAVVYNREDESGATAVQVRMSLNARQVVNIDGADQKSLSLQCGDSCRDAEDC